MIARFISSLLCISYINASDAIVIDGLWNDWDSIPIAVMDEEGDYNGDDWAELKISNDDEFVFFKILLHSEETLLQNWNNFHLYIDADFDSLTGHPFRGLGAELEWHFGERSGQYFVQDGIIDLRQNDITIRQAPTVTSNEFEIALGLDSFVLNSPDSIAIIFSSDNDYGDFMPNNWGGIIYQIDSTEVEELYPISLEKDGIRLVSYNTYNTGILESDRQPHFQRIFQALDPDIIALQEHTEWDFIGDIVSSWFPNDTWYQGYTFRDLVILSKYPILEESNLISSERTMCSLLEIDNPNHPYVLIINSHFSCCDNDDDRQDQVDELVQVLREWILNGDGPFDLPENTPIFHVGDFNFVGYQQQINTVTIGDIYDNSIYGDDFPLDWDGSSVIDLFSRHTHKRMGYTWRNDGSSFNPGKLDYIIYTDSNISISKHFILNTLSMPNTTLAEWGLESEDTNEASDHLPRVADFLINDLDVSEEISTAQNFALDNPYPNPFNPKINIPIYLDTKAYIKLNIYDIYGRSISTLVDGNFSSGKKQFYWDGTSHANGVYFIHLEINNQVYTHKIILLK
tara:strand:- start:224 stop:1936 length:1713 start_codon:yes stop_codon:yes gene_type:complete